MLEIRNSAPKNVSIYTNCVSLALAPINAHLPSLLYDEIFKNVHKRLNRNEWLRDLNQKSGNNQTSCSRVMIMALTAENSDYYYYYYLCSPSVDLYIYGISHLIYINKYSHIIDIKVRKAFVII